mgnify:CR=1 FL=1
MIIQVGDSYLNPLAWSVSCFLRPPLVESVARGHVPKPGSAWQAHPAHRRASLMPACAPLPSRSLPASPQVLPTQLVPDEKEGKILRVRLIMKVSAGPCCAASCLRRCPWVMCMSLLCCVGVHVCGCLRKSGWLAHRRAPAAIRVPTIVSRRRLLPRFPLQDGKKLFDPVYLFDQGSTLSWIPCGRKLTCSFPGACRWLDGGGGTAHSSSGGKRRQASPLLQQQRQASQRRLPCVRTSGDPRPPERPPLCRHQDVLRPRHLLRRGGVRPGDGRPVRQAGGERAVPQGWYLPARGR